jgi:hypothetical protein
MIAVAGLRYFRSTDSHLRRAFYPVGKSLRHKRCIRALISTNVFRLGLCSYSEWPALA